MDLLVLEEPLIISYVAEGNYLIKNNISTLKEFWKIYVNSNFDELFTDEMLRRSLGSDVFWKFY